MWDEAKGEKVRCGEVREHSLEVEVRRRGSGRARGAAAVRAPCRLDELGMGLSLGTRSLSTQRAR